LRAQTRDEAGRIDNIIMTSAEVAEFLKVHLGSVRRWSRESAVIGDICARTSWPSSTITTD
jgi:hypothetical protein